MTVKRDLKKRVRARQEQTGERYTTALEQVKAERAGGEAAGTPGGSGGSGGSGGEATVPVIEMVDLTPTAQFLCLHGRVLMYPHLAERVDPRATLLRIRDALIATKGDPASELLRRALLEGKPIPEQALDPRSRRETAVQFALMYGATLKVPPEMSDRLSDSARFLARARAGLGGISVDGRMLALPVPGHQGIENVVALLWGPWKVPGMPHVRPQTLMLGSADQMLEETGDLAEMVKKHGRQP
jgi:hypothetical protein